MSESKKNKVKSLKIKRKTIEENISHFKNFFDGFDKTNGNELEVEARLNHLMNSFSNLDHIEDELISLGEKDEGFRMKLKDQFFSITCEAQLFLKNSSSNMSDAQSSSLPSFRSQDDTVHQLKFKSVPLPNFSGEYSEWNAFKNKFLAYVDSRKFSKTDKLTLLQSAMQGDASEKISYLDPSEDNYDRAWSILNLSYENKKLIKTSHILKILNLPKLTSDNNYKALSNIAILLHKHLNHCLR